MSEPEVFLPNETPNSLLFAQANEPKPANQLYPDIQDLTWDDKQRRIIANTTTDAGACFEAGNIFVAAKESYIAAIPSFLVLLAVLGARATHEYKKAGMKAPVIDTICTTLNTSALTNNPVTNNPATRSIGRNISHVFDKMVDNPNIGLEVAGAGLALASITIPVVALSTGNTETLDTLYHWGTEEAILLSFAAADGCLGVSKRFNNKAVQNILKSAGINLATLGLIMVSGDPALAIDESGLSFREGAFSDPDTYIQSLLVTSGFMSVWQSICDTPTKGLMQPYLLFATAIGGNVAASAYQGDWVMAVANFVWMSAYVSLDAVFKKGGLHQKYFTGSKPKDQSDAKSDGPHVV